MPRDGLIRTIDVTRLLGVSSERLREVARKVDATSSSVWDESEVRRMAAWLIALGTAAEKTSARAGLDRLPAVMQRPER